MAKLILTVRGKTGTIAELCAHFGVVSPAVVHTRRWRNPSISWEEAITTPPGRRLETTALGMKGSPELLCRYAGKVSYVTALRRCREHPSMTWEEAIRTPAFGVRRPRLSLLDRLRMLRDDAQAVGWQLDALEGRLTSRRSRGIV